MTLLREYVQDEWIGYTSKKLWAARPSSYEAYQYRHNALAMKYTLYFLHIVLE